MSKRLIDKKYCVCDQNDRRSATYRLFANRGKSDLYFLFSHDLKTSFHDEKNSRDGRPFRAALTKEFVKKRYEDEGLTIDNRVLDSWNLSDKNSEEPSVVLRVVILEKFLVARSRDEDESDVTNLPSPGIGGYSEFLIFFGGNDRINFHASNGESSLTVVDSFKLDGGRQVSILYLLHSSTPSWMYRLVEKLIGDRSGQHPKWTSLDCIRSDRRLTLFVQVESGDGTRSILEIPVEVIPLPIS